MGGVRGGHGEGLSVGLKEVLANHPTTWKGKAGPIALAEAAKVVKKLLGGKAPGVDEIRPEMLKALDIVGLSWLTRFFNVAWGSGTVPMDWQIGVVVPIFFKGDRRVCSNYRGISLCQGARKEAPTVDQTSDSRQAVRILSRSWNCGPAFLPSQDYCRGPGSLPNQFKCALWTCKRPSIWECCGGCCGSMGFRSAAAAAAVKQALRRTVLVKRELSRKAKLSIY